MSDRAWLLKEGFVLGWGVRVGIGPGYYLQAARSGQWLYGDSWGDIRRQVEDVKP